MKTYKEMTESIISRSSGIITTKANKRYEIIKGLRLLAFCAVVVVLVVALTSHKNSASKSSTPETSTEKSGGIMIQGTESRLTEEELFSTGIIVRGIFTGLEDTRWLDIGLDKPIYCDLYGIEVIEYLYDETEDYADKIYAELWAGLVLPDELEEGKEYIFLINNTGEVEGDNLFCFYSIQQGIFAANENGKYEIPACGDRELSCEDIRALVKKYH